MTEAFPRADLCELQQEVASPGFGAGTRLGPAFELKFQLTPEEALAVEAWARRHLSFDPHGPQGTYRVTSVYCDTPRLDVFHRSPGFRRSKFRVRRYDAAPGVFLERKSKKKGRVRKKRVAVSAAELPLLNGADWPPTWAGGWFLKRVRRRALQPSCCLAYQRTAFFGLADAPPVRLTLDRDLIGAPARDWEVPPLHAGQPLLPGAVLLELKFHVQMPGLFHGLLPQLPLTPARGSKYRRCIQLCGPAENFARRDQESAVPR